MLLRTRILCSLVELDLHESSMTLTLGCPPALLVNSVLPQCGPKRRPHLRRPTLAADHHFHGRGMVRAAMAGLVGFLPLGFLYVEPAGTVAGLVIGEPQVVAAKASSVESILARQLARRCARFPFDTFTDHCLKLMFVIGMP